MIDPVTRVRISEIANELWRILRQGVLLFAETQDFRLQGSDFQNDDPDSACIRCELIGDPRIVVHLRDIQLRLSVQAPQLASFQAGYRIGSRALGTVAVIERDAGTPVNLTDPSNDAPVRTALDLLIPSLRRDLAAMLQPARALERKDT